MSTLSHFTDGKTKVQRGAAQAHMVSSRPGTRAPAPKLDSASWPALAWFHRDPSSPRGERSTLPPQQLWDRGPFTEHSLGL